jgi:uncharacterized RDD family membrane protein YckC
VSQVPAAGSVPATLGRRLLARFVDVVAALVLGGALLVGGLVSQLRADEPAVSVTTVVGAALVVGQALAQWWLVASRGYTVGRLLCGLRVVTVDQGRPLGAARIVLRELVVLACWAVPVLGPVLLGVSMAHDRTDRRRGWQDRACGAMVFDINAGVDPVNTPPSPREATEHLQALLGEQDRRRLRSGPQRVATEHADEPAGPGEARLPTVAEELGRPPAAPDDADRQAPTVAKVIHRTRVVPQAPYEQVSNASYRDLDDDVESTRLRQARSKVAYAPTRAQTRPRATLLLWDNRVVVLEGTALVGRNPSPREGEALPVQVIAVVDRGRSVSKTHLAIGVDVDGVWLKDRNSTNGTVVTLEDGQQILCAPEQKVRVPVGASIAFGDYWLTVAG